MLVVSVLFWLIFSILGVQLFSGKFQACFDSDGKKLPANVVPNKTECLHFPEKYTWANSDVNFDNVLNGFLALFQVVSSLLLSSNSCSPSFCYKLLSITHSTDKIINLAFGWRRERCKYVICKCNLSSELRSSQSLKVSKAQIRNIDFSHIDNSSCCKLCNS